MSATLPARPVGVRHSRYVFRVRGRDTGVTLLEMANEGVLAMICGGDLTWLRESFPARSYQVPSVSPLGVSPDRMVTLTVTQGINALAAARYLASLCIDAEARRLEVAFRAPPARETWWQRLRRRLRVRLPPRLGFVNPRTGFML